MARQIGNFTHSLLSLSVLALLSACGGPAVTENPLPVGNSGPPSGANPNFPNNPGTNNPTPNTPVPPDAPNLVGELATANANPAVLSTTRTTVYELIAPALGAGGWQPTALLETSDEATRTPQVAFDRAGNGFAVWAQGSDVIARRYDGASGTWGEPALLDDSAEFADRVRVAVDRDSGNAFAIWTQSDGAAVSLYASRFNTLTNTWSDAELLETAAGAVNNGEDNSFVALEGGHGAVVWLQNDGAALNIYLSRLVGGSWTTPVLVEESSEAGEQPKVAIDSSGNVTVAWRQRDPVSGARRIYSRRWDSTTQAFGSVMAMNDSGDRHPRLQFDAAGNGFLAWRGSGFFTRRFDAASGQWSGELALNNPGAGGESGEISVDEHGNAMAAWIENNAGNSYIYVRRYNAAANSWGDAELLDTSSNVVSLVVSMSGDDAVVSWLRLNESRREDVYSIKQTDGVWEQVRLLETRNGSASQLSSTINSAGNAAVVWTQSDDSNLSIFEARHLSPNLVVAAGDTWQSLANDLYGVNAVEAGLALQAAMGGGELSEGMILSGFPDTLTVTVTVPGFYTVLATDTWAHVAATVYGVTDVAAINQLRAALGNPTLAAGLQLVVPSSFTYITSANFSAPLDWSRVNTTATEYYSLDSSLLTVPLNDWSAEQALETSNQPATQPRVAFDAQDNGIVVWAQGSDVIARRYIAGSGWGAPTVLDTNPNATQKPRIAMDRTTGNAIVSWIQSDGGAHSMYVSTFDASSNTWSVAMLLENSNNPLNTVWTPAVSINGEHGMATWLQASDADPNTDIDYVYLSRLVAGTWTTPVRLDTGTQGGMQIEGVVDANGNVTVSWRQLNSAVGEHIATRRWDNTALALGPVMRMSVDGDRQGKIGQDAQGNAILLWRGAGVRVRHYDVATDQWGPQQILTSFPEAGLAELSVSPSGNALAAWPETVDGVSTMYARHYNASTGTWSPATAIGSGGAVKVTVSLVGDSGVVGWVTDNGSGGGVDVYAARYQDGVWGAATLMETMPSGADDVSASIDGSNNATVVWQVTDNAAPSIYYSRSNSTPYYLVPAGATWQSLAATLYGVDSEAAAEALEAAMGQPTLSTGLHLQGPPATLVVTPEVPTYYIVQSGDTWQGIALALYGTDRSEAATALWNYVGRPSLTVGQTLAIPSQLDYTINEE
ncbi:LysM peptidoglycan-binding domain-containing protein [Steroidobacter sp. S1-65]|uniref:LysM peptidoglycan-binding domain-containing protein n=1 Tax=Steroidobacter gossypii TaxID=2805490 RepID=A0ABS1X2F5_9GAMM|nr:LysM peptidoglycan-binding domain-containing protein [Steroidobacter gossypii]MBM0107352.1 LysM peptidoglycan-binding domain-containing protein [Steroidobacter gossypii]